MKRISAAENNVYIIFRVFNLYTDAIDVKLYIYPLELERQGQLEFTADKFTVRAKV